MKAIVTGGGTGGHIYPALAIADKIREEFDDAEILYIGTPNSLEEKISGKYGYEFASVEVKGFQRKLSVENLKRVWMANQAIKDAKKIIKEFKPDVVVGTGGYVAGPVVYAAQKCKVLTMIHEQNAYPGITNKLLAKKVDRVYLGFDSAKNKFKTKAPIKTIGNPVRREILEQKSRETARKILGLKTQKFILISGGSSGFDAINEAAMNLIPKFVEEDIGFIFSTGTRHFENVIGKVSKYLAPQKFMVVDYIEDMPDYIYASDLCIISAGATTIAEMNAAGRASIIIPKAYSAENHQEVNAKNIQDHHAGYYIKEKDLNADVLYKLVTKILGDEKIRLEMENCSKALYEKDPCEEIIKDIKQILKG